MPKKTILLLSLISIGIAIFGGILYGIGNATAPTDVVSSDVSSPPASSCQDTSCIPWVTATTTSKEVDALEVVAVVVFVFSGIVGFIGWISAIIRSARMQTWNWFVVILVLSGLGTLIYAIAGPADQVAAAAAAPSPGYAASGAPPPYPRQ